MSHTPGPWSIDELEVQCQNGCPVAYVHADFFTHTLTDQANARLIAAAPELLNALRVARVCIHMDRVALADCHMHPVTNELDEDGRSAVEGYDAVLATIDAAINKATEG